MDAVMLKVDIARSFGSFELRMRFEHEDGVLVLFGPSGAGKTTTLRCIAGIEQPDRGSVSLDGRILVDRVRGVCLPIRRRRVGYLFQTPTLFPHMTTRENIAYAATHGDRAFDVDGWLGRLGLADLSDRRPATLSGGEQQRVSLIRALAAKPALLLLDEPMSAVDVPTRQSLVRQLREVQRESGVPFVYVTHSATEAMQIGDRMLMMGDGRIVDDGVPRDVLHAPTSVPLARLSGTENLLTGVVVSHDSEDHTSALRVGDLTLMVPALPHAIGADASVAFRPEDVLVAKGQITGTSARNQFAGTVKQIEVGAEIQLIVAVDEQVTLRARVTRKSIDSMKLQVGTRVHLLIKTWSIYVIEESSLSR